MSDLAIFKERSTVTLVRSLPGPIERVWAYITEPKLLAKWFSDGAVSDHVGGDVHFEMGASGCVTAFEPPHLLEYTWNKAEEPSCAAVFDTRVRWELAEDGDRVRLTVTHSLLRENELVGHAAGWHTFVDRLQATLEDRNPVPIPERFEQLKTEYEQLLVSAGSGHVS